MALDTPDAELLRQYVTTHSSAAFAELTERYLGVVYRAALRQVRGDQQGAADVAQEVFLLLARKAPRLGDHACLVGWLHTTTRYVARDALRTAACRQHYEQQAATTMTPDQPPPPWERLRPMIDEALGELGERDRQAVLLRYFAELSFAAIGQRLGLAENTARMRVERALEKLQGRLRARGIESTGTALGLLLASEASAGTVPAGLAHAIVTTAAAGTTTVTAGAWIGLMTAGKTTTWLAAAVLVATLGIWGNSLRQKHAAEAALAEAQAQEADLAQRVAKAETVARELEARVTQLATAPAATTPPITSSAPYQEGKMLLAKYPELKRSYVAWIEANIRHEFEPLFRELKLTPEQIQRFIEITCSDGYTMGMGYGPSGKPVLLTLGEKEANDSKVERLTELLGPVGVQQWGKYVNTTPDRNTVARLARDLTFSETPLTPQQAESLTSVVSLARHAPAGQPRARREVNWEEVTEQAQTLLSPAQLTALTAIRDEAFAQRQATAANSSAVAGKTTPKS